MQPYLPIIPSVLAVISAFVALVVAQFFRDHMIAKVILVAIAGFCAAGAITATICNQNQIERARIADQQRHKEIRAQLGSFMKEGLALMGTCMDNSKPPPWGALNDWAARLAAFLKDKLDESDLPLSFSSTRS